jgi:Fe2+ or Zn2+ uptake regulation protein
MRSVPTMVELFRQAGLKITPQRRVIFQALADGHNHPTAEEVYQQVVSGLPDTSRTTVYNTLHELVDLGALAEINLGDGKTRYDVKTEPHHHLHCLRCHSLVDVQRSFAGLELPPEERRGYRILRSRVTFDGYCASCKSD